MSAGSWIFSGWDLKSWEVMLGHFLVINPSSDVWCIIRGTCWGVVIFNSSLRMTRMMVIQVQKRQIGLKQGNMGAMTHSGFESYPTRPCLECRLRWPFACKNDLWRKLKLALAKVFVYRGSFGERLCTYTYMYNIVSVPMFRSMFSSKGRMAMATRNTGQWYQGLGHFVSL